MCFHLICIKLAYVVTLIIFSLQLYLNILRIDWIFLSINIGSELQGGFKKIMFCLPVPNFLNPERSLSSAAWLWALGGHWGVISPDFFSPSPDCLSSDNSLYWRSVPSFWRVVVMDSVKTLKCLGEVFSNFASLSPAFHAFGKEPWET